MNFRSVAVVCRKELVDILRDHRTVAAMILIPVVLYPVLAVIMLQAVQVERGRRQQERYVLLVPDAAHEAWAKELFAREAERASKLAPVPAGAEMLLPPTAQAEQFAVVRTDAPLADAVREGKGQLALQCEPGVPDEQPAAQPIVLTLHFDDADARSEFAVGQFQPLLEAANQRLANLRLKAAGLDPSVLRPLEVRRNRVATADKVGGYILGLTLPYFLVMMTVTGAIYPAVDLTVGERERGTLESLMTAPIDNAEVMAGKFLAATTAAVLSALANLASLMATVWFALRSAAGSLPDGLPIELPFSLLPAVVLVIVPLASFFAALLLATCSFARSLKEAQLYITPVLVLALLPPILVLSPTVRLTGAMLVMPVANVLVLLREMFQGNADLASVAIVFGSTTLYAVAAVLAAAMLFGEEAVLFADAGSYRTLLYRKYFRPAAYPSANAGMLLAAAVFPVWFHFQSAALSPGMGGDAARFLGNAAATLLLFFLVPPLLTAWYLRASFAKTFSLATPAPRAWFGAALAGLGFPGVALGLHAAASWYLPLSSDDAAGRQAVESLLAGVPLPWLILVLAGLPAVCEEVFFRGWLLASLRRSLPPWGACLAVGVVFGMFHVDVHRVPLATVLGIALAWMTLRSGSLLPAMLAHFLNNAVALALAGATLPAVGTVEFAGLAVGGGLLAAGGVALASTGGKPVAA